jgi:hypothetical protein
MRLGYILAKKFQKDRKTSWNSISCPILGHRSVVTVGEGTEDAPNLSAEGGTENVAWSDRVTNAEIRKRIQRTWWQRLTVSSGNGVAMWQMGTEATSMWDVRLGKTVLGGGRPYGQTRSRE